MLTNSNRVYFDEMLGRGLQEGFTEVSLAINHYWRKYSRLSPFLF